MKFLSLIILIVLLGWTWAGYKHTGDVPVAVHYNLQNELRNFIADYIGKNVKGASNLQFYKFWTEPTQTKEVRAVFEYSFDTKNDNNEETTTRLKGYAFLTPEGGLDQWSLDKVEVNNQIIDFKSGSVITPQKDSQ
jgi:hypothetical protein